MNKKPNILMIDDEIGLLEEMESWLGEKGFDVDTASSGFDGLKKINSSSPDLLLLDITMPGLDGFEVLKYMKKNPRLNHVPIIMLTARSEVSYIFKAQEMNVVEYVTKPFDEDELLKTIHRYI